MGGTLHRLFPWKIGGSSKSSRAVRWPWCDTGPLRAAAGQSRRKCQPYSRSDNDYYPTLGEAKVRLRAGLGALGAILDSSHAAGQGMSLARFLFRPRLEGAGALVVSGSGGRSIRSVAISSISSRRQTGHR